MIARLAGAFVALAASLLAVPAPAQSATAHEPIVFVHGWNGSADGYDFMKQLFVSDGWAADELFVFSYDSSQSNVTTAVELAAYVDDVLAATGASKVDIVTHSMGGLSSRHYVKFLGGLDTVDEWVSVAGPNHGTYAANLCTWQQACLDMQPGSPFLTQLNAGDETPGAVRYGTFRSLCDEAMIPNSTTVLNGASNYVTGCQEHALTIFDPYIYSLVRDFVK